MTPLKADSLIKELQKLGSPTKARGCARFFKTAEGQYGYGDVFWGLSAPAMRRLAKEYGDLPLLEIQKLLNHKIHECRQTGFFILVHQYQKSSPAEKKRFADFYLANREKANNWDLVDCSAPQILGDYLLDKNKIVLYKLACSKNLWGRRIAIIATLGFIDKGKLEDTFKIAEILIKDKHDLIHKAVGWALREAGKKSLSAEERFLKKYAAIMPRTMLRYAIEKFPENKRQKYLARKNKKTERRHY